MGMVAEQKEARRAHILSVARDLIEGHGYEGVTMRHLAAASGVSVPTLYNLCGNKDELLHQAVTTGFDATAGAMAATRARGHGRVLHILRLGAEEVDRHPGYYRSMLDMVTRSAQAQAPMLVLGQRMHSELVAALTEMRQLGQLEGWVDIPVLAERLTATCVTAAFEWAAGFASPERARAVTLFTSCSMLATASRGRARQTFERQARSSQRALAEATGP